MPREGRAVLPLQAQGSLQRTMPSASRFMNASRVNQRIRIPRHRVERQEKRLDRPHRYQRYENPVQAGHWRGSNCGVQASVGGARETSTQSPRQQLFGPAKNPLEVLGQFRCHLAHCWKEAHQQAYVMTKITSRPIYWGSLQLLPYIWQSR